MKNALFVESAWSKMMKKQLELKLKQNGEWSKPELVFDKCKIAEASRQLKEAKKIGKPSAERFALAAGCHENQLTKRNQFFERKKLLNGTWQHVSLHAMFGAIFAEQLCFQLESWF